MSYRLELDTPVEYELTVESLQMSEVQGTTSQTAQRLTSRLIQQIQGINDNRILVSYLFRDPAVTIQGDYPFSFNTDNLKNKAMTISVSDRGVDPTITNLEDFNEKLNYNLESISQLFFPELSDNSVPLNGSWTSVRNVPIEMSEMTLSLDIITQYSFIGVETIMDQECMVFQGESDISLSGTSIFEGVFIDLEGKGIGISKYSFAYKIGRLITGHREEALSMTGQVKDRNIVVPIKQRLASEFKVIE